MLKRELKELNTQYCRNIISEAAEDKDALLTVKEKLQIDLLTIQL